MCRVLAGDCCTVEGEGAKAIYDFTAHTLKVLQALEIDALIRLAVTTPCPLRHGCTTKAFRVAIPKTMDNDVYGTTIVSGFRRQ